MEGPTYPKIDNLKIHTKRVEKLLQRLKINRASGLDDLPAYILRNSVAELAPVVNQYSQPYQPVIEDSVLYLKTD